VVIGADLGDPPVAQPEPLGAAVQPRLAGLRVAPGHRPLDHRLVAVRDPVLEPPLPGEVVDRPAGVLGDRAAVVGPEARVVVGRVVGEVRGDQVDVAGVERLVVAADVVEGIDADIFTFRQSICATLVRR
jgi:hypothetical protein